MNTEREATDDERAGMDWWNALTTDHRAHWLAMARSGVPADAWAAFKRSARADAGQEGARTQ